MAGASVSRAGVGLLTACLVVSCGGDGGDAIDAGVSLQPDAAVDANPLDDDNDSFDEAIPVDVDGPGAGGVIGTPGDEDFFTFQGEAGQWLIIDAIPVDFSSDFSGELSLYDANHTQLAQGLRINHHLAAAGTYYVKVADWMGGSGPDFAYTFAVEEPVDGQNDVYIDQEPGDDAASARPIAGGAFLFADLLGLYDHAGDRDVYSITLSGTGVKTALFFPPSPPGPLFDGSTSDFSFMWITDATGTDVLARVDPDDAFLLPPLPSPATYLLWVEKDAAPAGVNDFYAMALFGGGDDDPPEKETLETPGTNDTIALADLNAEVLVLSGSPPDVFFVSYLPAGDVDYLAFDLPQAVAISAFCAASAYGSGVVGLHAEIRDASDTMLSGGDEQFGGVSLDANLPAAGRYYVRLSAGGHDPVVTGNFVRCFIQIPSL